MSATPGESLAELGGGFSLVQNGCIYKSDRSSEVIEILEAHIEPTGKIGRLLLVARSASRILSVFAE
jgi:hypothetical protein